MNVLLSHFRVAELAQGMAASTKVEFDLYMEHPRVARMGRRDADDWRSRHCVKVEGGGSVPRPARSFLEASFPENITAELESSGFDRPTAIQSQSWPIVLKGHDVIGLAATGSGKTLCFALPALVHISAQPPLLPGDGPIALVLAPTRELALQIKGECDRFGGSSGVTNTAIYGGVPKGPQQRDLQQGVEIVIATPGRLIDFMDVRLRLAFARYLFVSSGIIVGTRHLLDCPPLYFAIDIGHPPSPLFCQYIYTLSIGIANIV